MCCTPAHLYATCVRVCCACTRPLLAGDTARTLMMEIIRNFLQLGRWEWRFSLGMVEERSVKESVSRVGVRGSVGECSLDRLCVFCAWSCGPAKPRYQPVFFKDAVGNVCASTAAPVVRYVCITFLAPSGALTHTPGSPGSVGVWMCLNSSCSGVQPVGLQRTAHSEYLQLCYFFGGFVI